MNIIIPKNLLFFSCEKCNLTTSNKKDFKKHCITRKHQNNHNLEYLEQKNPEYPFVCKYCEKGYKVRHSLWYHEKKCIPKNKDNENVVDNELTQKSAEVVHLTNLVIKLMTNNEEIQKQHNAFQKQTLEMQTQMNQKMIDVCKNNNNTINSNNNNNNKTFNMQVFLNEKCKDAMNIMDFVNSMTLQLSDLEDVGELGYVEGISKIIIRKLNEMDVYKRPIHCSDYKREVMYVRDDDIWEKENSTYDKIRKAIKYITKKNGDLMIPWRDKHPSCMNTTHWMNDVYLRIMNQSMGGKGEFVDSENKIIKKLSKAVYIDKEY
jgi:hypothetical protein